MYPNAQILPNYDPDVSFANIENRLQMLVMNAKQEILEEMKNEIEEVITIWKVKKNIS